MKVKIESKNYQPTWVLVMVVAVFGGFSAFALIRFFLHLDGDYSFDSFYNTFIADGIFVLSAVGFGLLTLYFIGAMIKPPRAYRVRLTEKKSDILKGREITRMVFESNYQKKTVQNIGTIYPCYIEGKSDYILGCYYDAYIKEFDWKIKAVKNPGNDAKSEMMNASMIPVLLMFYLIFGGSFIFCLFSVIKCLNDNSPIFGSVIGGGICLGMVAIATIMYKKWKNDNVIVNQLVTGCGPSSGNETLHHSLNGSRRFKIEKRKFVELIDRYVVKDMYDNIVYELTPDLLTHTEYKIEDSDKMYIGSVRSDILDGVFKMIITLEDYRPFSVRRKATMRAMYEISGIDYTAVASPEGYRIYDLNNKLQARIQLPEDGEWAKNQREVVLEDGIENNIYLVFVAVGVYFGHKFMIDRRFDD